jgi:hypothetical protein
VSFPDTVPAGILELDLFTSAPEPGRESAFLILLAFLLSFAFIRTSARLIRDPRVTWWPGNVEAGGVHIHHLVWGISLLLVSGFAAFVSDLETPWWQITAIGFGIGAGLTLDEFALWLRLEDVYWSEQGRSSIDAVIMTALIAALVVLGLRPFGFDDPGSVIAAVAITVALVALAVVSFAKGRILLGAISIFVPVVGIVAAARLAKPGSPWAHWFYGEAKRSRARERYASGRRLERLGRRVQDVIGGAPSD